MSKIRSSAYCSSSRALLSGAAAGSEGEAAATVGTAASVVAAMGLQPWHLPRCRSQHEQPWLPGVNHQLDQMLSPLADAAKPRAQLLTSERRVVVHPLRRTWAACGCCVPRPVPPPCHTMLAEPSTRAQQAIRAAPFHWQAAPHCPSTAGSTSVSPCHTARSSTIAYRAVSACRRRRRADARSAGARSACTPQPARQCTCQQAEGAAAPQAWRAAPV